MLKHEAKKIARSFTSRKTISDVEALGVLYEIQEKKSSQDINEAIATLEKVVLGGNKGDDVLLFIDEPELECYKLTREESYQQPYRSLIDEWGAATIREFILDVLNIPCDYGKELELLAKQS